jgi:Tol biopolymer transport system component
MDRQLTGKYVVLAVAAIAGLVTVMCVGLVAAVLVARTGDEASPATERLVDVVDRIAFVGNDGNLYMIDRNGENIEYLAVGEVGTALDHPTWSPDGQRVAFVARREAENGVESILYTVSTTGDKPATLYASVENPAFYMYWSPDSRYISFLTQEDTDLALRLAPANGSEAARVLERGAPFYWSWSPDSQEMLLHVGGARRLNQEARLALLVGQPESTVDVLDDAPADFQAPAWSPDGNRLLYAAENELGRRALYVRQRDSGVVQKLIDVSGVVRFDWSPDGQWIAYQQISDPRIAPLGHVFLMRGDGSDWRRLSRDWAVALFWSPDSQHLAILSPSLDEDDPSARTAGLASPLPQADGLLLRWWLVDMPDGEIRPLVRFRPSRSLLTIIPYFDQYGQSIRFWSPDSRYLLYSVRESLQESGIWVADVNGEEPPRRLTDGSAAVWSWK